MAHLLLLYLLYLIKGLDGSTLEINNKKLMTTKCINEELWNEWFAGIADGDGCFYINKKENSLSFEVTTHITDIRVVTNIKNILKVGTVKIRSNSQSVRYRVKAKAAIIDIFNRLNGKLYNPARVKQFIAACEIVGITPKVPTDSLFMEKKSYAYLAGLIDSDGSLVISVSGSTAEDSQLSNVHGKITRLTYSKAHNQITLKVTTSYKTYAELIQNTFGFGKIYTQKPNIKNKAPNTLYHWTVTSQQDFELLYESVKTFPLKSLKMHRLRLSLLYFKYKNLKYHLKEAGTIEGKTWAKFANTWYKYSY
uniref:Putative site-specific DNA endonuclease n=1 Tax=Astrephomene gubernaculifera TaxID=47775 RepID=A0A7R6ULG7_9CHLO|nr:putative site-specific DNA endonuclease [Astrephomene gubernaculifera]